MDWTVFWFMLPVCVVIAAVAMFSGISGAAMLTPLFLIGFPLLAVPTLTTVEAIGTSLVLETSGFGSGVVGYVRRRLPDYTLLRRLVLLTVPAGILGAVLARAAPSETLKAIYGIAMFVVAAVLLSEARKHGAGEEDGEADGANDGSGEHSSDDREPAPSGDSLASLRERHARDLRRDYPRLDPRRLTILADRLARIESAQRWLDEHPAGVVRGEGGDVFPVVEDLERWSTEAERALGYAARTGARRTGAKGAREGEAGDQWEEDGTRYIRASDGRVYSYRPHGLKLTRALTGSGALVAGLISTGVGEATLPNLVRRVRMPVAVAAATSTLVVASTVVGAALAHLVQLASEGGLGAIPWNLLAWAVPGAIVGAQIGTRLQGKIDQRKANYFFTALFLVVGAAFLLSVTAFSQTFETERGGG